MAGTGSSSPFIKDEPDDQLFSSSQNQRFANQAYNMPQQHFNQFGGSHGNGGSINPNDLTMPMTMQSGSYMGGGFQNNFTTQASNPNASFSKGHAVLDDDDLLESLGNFQDQNHNQNGIQSNGQNYNGLDDFDFNATQNIYPTQNGISMDQQTQMNNIYSNTPDGDPIQSPFVHNFNHQALRQLQQQQQFGGSLQSPGSFAGSPLAGTDMHNGSVDTNYMNAKARARPSLTTMQRKSSNTRSPLTPKTPGLNMGSLDINGTSTGGFPSQPIRTTHSHRHQKTSSGAWDPQSASSMTSFPGSGFSSPIQAGIHPNPQISDILKTGSLPPKLNGNGQAGSAPAMQTQEMKRRRRRESHNLVERRRRDNINERIQELSHLVPLHRLEDEKLRKALQNNSPLSPSLGATSMSPPQATSGLGPPGAKRATGNITQGIPIEEKDKGPNKGDILNGAVSWTRDLMWMLHMKLQQQEELANIINDLGGQYPFNPTEDEKRMQTELLDAMDKNGVTSFSYSRAHGTGLRVPKHTDAKGDPVGSSSNGHIEATSLSPDNHSTGDAGQTGVGGIGQYWSGHNSGGSGTGSISFKEEDEYMDLN